MKIKDLANVICTKDTSSKDRSLKVIEYTRKRLLWEGKAKDLSKAESTDKVPLNDFTVVEILVDWSDCTNPAIYNKNKIISVI